MLRQLLNDSNQIIKMIKSKSCHKTQEITIISHNDLRYNVASAWYLPNQFLWKEMHIDAHTIIVIKVTFVIKL